MTAKEMKARLAAARDEVRALQNGAKNDKGEKRELNADENTKVDALLDEIEKLEQDIPVAEASERRAARLGAIESADKREKEARKAPPADPSRQPEQRSEIVVRGHVPPHANIRAFGDNYEESKRNAYTAGMFFAGAIYGNATARQWCEDHGIGFAQAPHSEARALGSNAPTTGGILVPDNTMATIIVYRNERGVFAREAHVVPMSVGSDNIPRRTGGVTWYPLTQNPSADTTDSTPTFDSVPLVPREWGALVKLSRVLNEDAIVDLGAYVTSELGYGLANIEDTAGFNGDGTSTYQGIQGVTVKVNNGNHAGSIFTAATGNTGFETLDYVDFTGAMGKLPLRAGLQPKWYISKQGWANSMQRLMDAAGGNTNLTLGAGAPTAVFSGAPVVLVDVLNSTLGAQTSTIVALYGDLRQTAKLGYRRQMDVQVLNELLALRSQIGIHATARFDINVHELGDATNAGNMIALKTPSS